MHNSKRFHITYKARTTSRVGGALKIWCAQPSSSSTQSIERFNISLEPKNTYEDNQNNKILYCETEGKNIEIGFDFQATLQQQRIILDNDRITIPTKTSKIYKQYTKSEPFLEQDERIKNLIKNQGWDKKNNIAKTLKSIFDFVSTEFTYQYPITQRGVKNLKLNNLQGDCAEYSGLFVTICRMLGMPARNETGFVLFPEHKQINEHGWASIYLEPYGWIYFDTQYAAIDENPNAYFSGTNDYRIAFTHGFNIPLEPKVPEEYSVALWNSLGLPMTHSSVQTLQPLVCSSSKNIKFEDSLEVS